MKNKFLYFQLLILGLFTLAGCTHPDEKYSNLKSVQVFHSNSGSNYIFENGKTMEKKHAEKN